MRQTSLRFLVCGGYSQSQSQKITIWCTRYSYPDPPTLALFYEKKKAANKKTRVFIGCGIFAYSWKLPADSGAFLLTIDYFSVFLLTVGAFLLTALAFILTVGAFRLQWESASNKGLKGL